MPNQLSPLLEERIGAVALGDPGLGPRRIAAELARPRWGGLVVSANGVWRCLCRHGLNTRGKRLSLGAGYAAPYEPPRPAPFEQQVEAERPGELVGFDCSFVGRLHNLKETVWQLTAIDVCSSYTWANLVSCKHGQPSAAQTSKLAQRVAEELRAAGWRLEPPQDGSEISRTCRHISEAVHSNPPPDGGAFEPSPVRRCLGPGLPRTWAGGAPGG